MPQNPLSQNELDRNAMGGTELMALGLHGNVKPELLEKFNIIRSRVRHVEIDKPNILWLHDLAEDPEAGYLSQPEWRKQFHKLVFVSHWQQEQYNLLRGVPFSEGVVIRNAIKPFAKHEVVEHRSSLQASTPPIRLIYHSTPHRGLNILYHVMNRIHNERPDLDWTLDVYSSFKLYGWESRDIPYQDMFNGIKAHPRMRYHGTVPNEEIRRALLSSHAFVYPSTWKETSCLCAIEAMAAGCDVITSSLAALPETLAVSGIVPYPYHEVVSQHAETLMKKVIEYLEANMALRSRKFYVAETVARAERVNEFYGWPSVAPLWERLLSS
jgi:glycosyltransferase involved in cell wall biosynthesis